MLVEPFVCPSWVRRSTDICCAVFRDGRACEREYSSQPRAPTTITAITAPITAPVLWRLASPSSTDALEGMLGWAAGTRADEAAALCWPDKPRVPLLPEL